MTLKEIFAAHRRSLNSPEGLAEQYRKAAKMRRETWGDKTTADDLELCADLIERCAELETIAASLLEKGMPPR